MTLPASYPTSVGYLSNSLDFLHKYKWIFLHPNTDILLNRVFDEIKHDWKSYFTGLNHADLRKISNGEQLENAPQSFNLFLQELTNLKPNFQSTSAPILPGRQTHGLSSKKQHEIEALAPKISEVCAKTNTNLVLDIGAGLGYLPELLTTKYKFDVVGVESCLKKVETAIKRAKQSNNQSIKYIHHFITDQTEIGDFLNGATSVCVSGLHACADLSVAILKLFIKSDTIKGLVIMPCCYHRMQQTIDGRFVNFPLSDELKRLDKSDIFSVAFMRIACQSSAKSYNQMSWAEIEQQATNCLFRAILQSVAHDSGVQVARVRRKSGMVIESGSDPFEAYLMRLPATHRLKPHCHFDADFFARMRDKWSLHNGELALVRALVALQVAVQCICENVVLYDRIVYVNGEMGGGGGCFVEKITDEGLSPRCQALIAVKS